MAPPASDLRVILQADDFGRDAPTTDAVLRCIEHGTITSATLMTNMPGTEAALGLARGLGRRVSVGVHLNLCEGRPLTSARTLVSRSGWFRSRATVLRQAAAARLDSDALEAEMVAQVRRARDAGVEISHLDSHKHLHVVPGISAIVARVARRFEIGHVRCPARLGLAGGAGSSTWANVLCRTLAARIARRSFTAAGLRSPDAFVDLRQLVTRSPHLDARRVRRLFAGGNRCIEVMCHPAASGGDSDVLLSEGFARDLAGMQARLCTYWDC